VPPRMRLAALRRAWSSDPAIRDFKGLQENDWNFEDPDSIPGFGELDPKTDIKLMVAELFSEPPRLAVRSPRQQRVLFLGLFGLR
jgi:hypothetical protein